LESIKLNKLGKTITPIFVVVEKKKEPKVMVGIDEVVIVFGIPLEKEKSSNNKTNEETIQDIYDMLDDNKPINEISSILGLSSKTIYNYKNKRVD